MKPTYGHYIDGAEVVGGHEMLEVRSPFDQSLVTTVAAAKAADVDVAVAAAAAAFADGRWSGLQPRQRARVLLKTAQLLTDEIGWLAEAESRQTGRCVREMRAQLARLPEWLEHFAALAQGMEGQVPPFSDAKHLNYVRRVPLGVCALITPWNHPLLIALKKIAPALAAGNTVVVKPSELAPVAVLELARIFTAAGLPAGVLNVVCGLGAVAGKALAEHATVAKLDLTGGTETGMLAAAAASRNLARVCMELGGNAPVLVFADADLEQAVNGVAFGAFVASGQTCISAKRVLVQEALLPAFRERLVAKAKGIVLGDPMAAGTQMGPLVSELQMRRVLSLVETAAPQGATLLCGGVRSSAAGCEAGWFVEPTVIGDVQPHFSCFQEEIFGPCVTLVGFADEAHALALANDSRFGLGAAVWTRDVARAHRVAQGVRAGIVWVNAHHRNDPSSPWGGFGHSGVGRENGWEALHEYTETQSVVVCLDDTPFDWFGGAERYN
mmetsp:Transcript_46087/g.148454  ORF Transcript_46087/g.148454 Transcript_46087/m.148454 type:complete len:497 (-) Transcript_46087:297-1787(-)